MKLTSFLQELCFHMETAGLTGLYKFCKFWNPDYVLGIDIDIEDDNGQNALALLCKHPSQRSQEITALIYGMYLMW